VTTLACHLKPAERLVLRGPGRRPRAGRDCAKSGLSYPTALQIPPQDRRLDRQIGSRSPGPLPAAGKDAFYPVSPYPRNLGRSSSRFDVRRSTFDVGCWMLDVRCSPSSFSYLATSTYSNLFRISDFRFPASPAPPHFSVVEFFCLNLFAGTRLWLRANNAGA